jgi:hypothetical protein
VSQDTLRLRKTAEVVSETTHPMLPESMETIVKTALSDIVKQALDQAIAPEQIVPPEVLREVSIPTDKDFAESTAELLQSVAPALWTKGQLLNVRNRGEFYVVTLLGEEDEPPLKPAPNGALRFTNTALCQDFVSKWYATEHHDPRAR